MRLEVANDRTIFEAAGSTDGVTQLASDETMRLLTFNPGELVITETCTGAWLKDGATEMSTCPGATVKLCPAAEVMTPSSMARRGNDGLVCISVRNSLDDRMRKEGEMSRSP